MQWLAARWLAPRCFGLWGRLCAWLGYPSQGYPNLSHECLLNEYCALGMRKMSAMPLAQRDAVDALGLEGQ
jgi:hypothetical protein